MKRMRIGDLMIEDCYDKATVGANFELTEDTQCIALLQTKPRKS